MALTKADITAIKKAMPQYNKVAGRNIDYDLKLLQAHERITDVRYRAPDKSKGWVRHYIEFDTDEVYFYAYDGSKRSKLGTFTIHIPLDSVSGWPEGLIPSITGKPDKHGNSGQGRGVYGPDQGASGLGGGGMLFKGNFKGFNDNTGEGRGYESYHPHIYGGGVELCLGGYSANMHRYRVSDLPAFVELLFKFIERDGGRKGDDGEARVSMYSATIKEIFARHTEKVTPLRHVRRKASKASLKKGLTPKSKKGSSGDANNEGASNSGTAEQVSKD